MELWVVDDFLFMFGYLEEVEAISRQWRSETAGSMFEQEFLSARPRPGYAGSRAGGTLENMADPGCAARSGANCLDPFGIKMWVDLRVRILAWDDRSVQMRVVASIMH